MDTSSAGGARSRVAWVTVSVLTVAIALSMLDRLALSGLLEEIRQNLHLTDQELGILQGGAFGLFYTLMGLPFGFLADRWSNRGAILVGYLIWNASVLTSGLASGYGWLWASRLGVGAGEAGLSPAGYSLLRQIFSPRRLSLGISLFQWGSVLGSSFAFAAVGGLHSLFKAYPPGGPMQGFAPWRLTFLALGVLGGIALPALWLLPKDAPRTEARSFPKGQLMQFLKQRAAIWVPLFFGMAGVLVATYAIMAWIAAIYQREFGWTPARFGPTFSLIVLGVGSLGMICGGLLTDFINARTGNHSHRVLPLVVCAILAPLVVAFGLLQSPALLLVVAATMLFLAFLPLSVAPVFVQVWAPLPIKGQLSALYILIVNFFSLSLAPIAIGYVSAAASSLQHYSLRFSVCVVAEAMLVISVGLLLWMRRRDRALGVEAI